MTRMMSSVVLMVISSFYIVEHPGWLRILPVTAPFAFFTLAFDLALRSFLSLETLFARRVAYGLLEPLKHDTPLSLRPRPFLTFSCTLAAIRPTRYYGNAYSRPSRPCDWPAYFTIRLFFTEVTPLTLLVISPAFLTAS
jgi:hypothetical protein